MSNGYLCLDDCIFVPNFVLGRFYFRFFLLYLKFILVCLPFIPNPTPAPEQHSSASVHLFESVSSFSRIHISISNRMCKKENSISYFKITVNGSIIEFV